MFKQGGPVFFKITLAALLLLFSPASHAAEKFVTIGTAGDYGVYFPAGGAICRFVTRGIKDHGIRCLVESTDGSIYNLQQVREKKLNFGMAQSDLQAHAYKGDGVFTKDGPNTKLRSVFSLHNETFTVVARKDAKIKTFTDLKGKRVNIGAPGSGMRYTMEELMKYMHWTQKSFRSVTQLRATEESKALCDNKIDAAIYVVGHPNGDVLDMTNRCDAVLVPIPSEILDKFVQENPYYSKSAIPKNMYPKNEAEVKSFSVRATLVTMEDEDEETVYQVVKALFDNFDNFMTLHPVFSTLDKKNMVHDGSTAPLHKGAEKYFREKKLIK